MVNWPAASVIARARSLPLESTSVRNAPLKGARVTLSTNCPRTVCAAAQPGWATAAIASASAPVQSRMVPSGSFSPSRFPPAKPLWLELREAVQIAGEATDEQRDHAGQDHAERPVCNQRGGRGPENDQGVERDQEQAYFGRPDPSVGNLEHAEHSRLQIHIDRQGEVHHHEAEGESEVHVRRQADAEADDG